MITFLVSGLWHGASWNYVLWGAYHGALLLIARARSARRTARPCRSAALVRPLQVAGMFVLTCVGWLIFRETELAQLQRDLQLTPADSTELGRSAGLYLFLLVGLYSIPLWIHDLWAELQGPRSDRGARCSGDRGPLAARRHAGACLPA